jgi:hypothetical protein
VLSHDVSDADNVARAASFFGLSAEHRVALVPGQLWLRSELAARLRAELSPALGARWSLYANDIGLGLRLALLGGIDAMPDRGAFSARGQLSLDRVFDLTPELALVPRVGLLAFYVSDRTLRRADTVDFEVWNYYGQTHPLQLQPSASLRWSPAPDFRLELRPGLAMNADFVSVDRLDVGLAASAVTDLVLPRSLVASVGFRSGYRFADEDRQFGYFRHDVSLELAYVLPLGPEARVVLQGSGTLFAREDGLDGMAFLTARLDWLDGRGLVDFAPSESLFAGVLAAPDEPPLGGR